MTTVSAVRQVLALPKHAYSFFARGFLLAPYSAVRVCVLCVIVCVQVGAKVTYILPKQTVYRASSSLATQAGRRCWTIWQREAVVREVDRTRWGRIRINVKLIAAVTCCLLTCALASVIAARLDGKHFKLVYSKDALPDKDVCIVGPGIAGQPNFTNGGMGLTRAPPRGHVLPRPTPPLRPLPRHREPSSGFLDYPTVPMPLLASPGLGAVAARPAELQHVCCETVNFQSQKWQACGAGQ